MSKLALVAFVVLAVAFSASAQYHREFLVHAFNSKCGICQMAVDAVKGKQGDLKTLLAHECEKLPLGAEVCKTKLSPLADKISSHLELPSLEVCQNIRWCLETSPDHSEKPVEKNPNLLLDLKCSSCQGLFTFIYTKIGRNLTNSDLANRLRDICSKAPYVVQGLCNQVISQNLDRIVAAYDNSDPNKICQSIRLCSANVASVKRTIAEEDFDIDDDVELDAEVLDSELFDEEDTDFDTEYVDYEVDSESYDADMNADFDEEAETDLDEEDFDEEDYDADFDEESDADFDEEDYDADLDEEDSDTNLDEEFDADLDEDDSDIDYYEDVDLESDDTDAEGLVFKRSAFDEDFDFDFDDDEDFNIDEFDFDAFDADHEFDEDADVADIDAYFDNDEDFDVDLEQFDVDEEDLDFDDEDVDEEDVDEEDVDEEDVDEEDVDEETFDINFDEEAVDEEDFDEEDRDAEVGSVDVDDEEDFYNADFLDTDDEDLDEEDVDEEDFNEDFNEDFDEEDTDDEAVDEEDIDEADEDAADMDDELYMSLKRIVDPKAEDPRVFYFGLEGKKTQAEVQKLIQRIADAGTGSAECQICQWAVSAVEAYISQQDTEQELARVLQELCTVLPGNYASICQNFVVVYMDEAVNYVIDNLTPPLVCSKLDVCPQAPSQEPVPTAAKN